MSINKLKQPLMKTVVPTLSKLPFKAWPVSVKGKFIPIFMLHRFECKDCGLQGHSVTMVEQCFEYLRKHKFDIISVEDAISIKLEGRVLQRPTIAFSIDDGYWDQFEIGSDVFQKYDCPTTYFVATRMLGGTLWLWDAKITYLIDAAKKANRLSVLLNYFNVISDNEEQIHEAIVMQLKLLPDEAINKKIDQVSKRLEIVVQEKVPDNHRYMSWADVKKLDEQGMKVGPHSRFHNSLTKLSVEDLTSEVKGSWNDLQDVLVKPAPIFCYPIGKKDDFGEREKIMVEQSGMTAALTALPGAMRLDTEIDFFSIPRYSFPQTVVDFKQYASWIEVYKGYLRARF